MALPLHRYNALLPAPHCTEAPHEGAALLQSVTAEFSALEAAALDGCVQDFGKLRRQLKKLVRCLGGRGVLRLRA